MLSTGEYLDKWRQKYHRKLKRSQPLSIVVNSNSVLLQHSVGNLLNTRTENAFVWYIISLQKEDINRR